MTAAWPDAKLEPPSLTQGYSFDFGDRRAATPFEQGATRQRSLVRTAKAGINVAWNWTADQYAIFRAFYAWTISDGADEFTMSIFTGSDYETLTVRFVKGGLRVAREGGEWAIKARLETDELPTMSSGDLDTAIGAASGFPAWPASFPQYVMNSVEPTFTDSGLRRSDFDLGAIEQRRVFFSSPVTYKQEFILSDAQFDIFRAWRRFRIFHGEGWFNVPIFQDAGYVTLKGRINAGTLTATRDGEEWRVTMEVELRELPVPSASVLT